jgi:hypothetical protein
MSDVAGVKPTVGVEIAAYVCGCSPAEMRRYRKQVLPRSGAPVPDPDRFTAAEVGAVAAGVAIKTWRTKVKPDQLVARLALRPGDDRDWQVVYESRRGVRVEPADYVVELWSVQRGARFDPTPVYEAFDLAVAGDRRAD